MNVCEAYDMYRQKFYHLHPHLNFLGCTQTLEVRFSHFLCHYFRQNLFLDFKTWIATTMVLALNRIWLVDLYANYRDDPIPTNPIPSNLTQFWWLLSSYNHGKRFSLKDIQIATMINAISYYNHAAGHFYVLYFWLGPAFNELLPWL